MESIQGLTDEDKQKLIKPGVFFRALPQAALFSGNENPVLVQATGLPVQGVFYCKTLEAGLDGHTNLQRGRTCRIGHLVELLTSKDVVLMSMSVSITTEERTDFLHKAEPVKPATAP